MYLVFYGMQREGGIVLQKKNKTGSQGDYMVFSITYVISKKVTLGDMHQPYICPTTRRPKKKEAHRLVCHPLHMVGGINNGFGTR
ncbi:hypothetical protein HanXRQr2_Chr17g0808581 [Helianthus annuus]|uniref:Uncharacterized protein n=1 Tax=Helianthus annuus TaxID=4232 RepID=A0A9K3DL05_HELAN|nr:hypothetical protein HanXRQr2_Chr17g0808581 [Helianthus annuus]